MSGNVFSKIIGIALGLCILVFSGATAHTVGNRLGNLETKKRENATSMPSVGAKMPPDATDKKGGEKPGGGAISYGCLVIEGGLEAKTVVLNELPVSLYRSVEVRGQALGQAPLRVVINEPLDLGDGELNIEAAEIIINKPVTSHRSIKLTTGYGSQARIIRINAPIAAPEVFFMASDSLIVNSQIAYESGRVRLLAGQYIGLTQNAQINVSGRLGGGSVYIGGPGLQNNAELVVTDVATGASIAANASRNGKGGLIWVAGGQTNFLGQATATGPSSQTHGIIEIWGRDQLGYNMPTIPNEAGHSMVANPMDPMPVDNKPTSQKIFFENTLSITYTPIGIVKLKEEEEEEENVKKNKTAIDSAAAPVIAISAIRKQQNIMLSWEATTEDDQTGYQIEMSEDGTEFKKIGYIKAKPKTNNRSSYKVEIKQSASSYFRIRHIEAGQTEIISPVVYVQGGDFNPVFRLVASGSGMPELVIEGLGNTTRLLVANQTGQVLLEAEGGAQYINYMVNKHLPTFGAGTIVFSFDAYGQTVTRKIALN